jgi:hypothetical protein
MSVYLYIDKIAIHSNAIYADNLISNAMTLERVDLITIV